MLAAGALTTFTGIACPKTKRQSPFTPRNHLSFVDVSGLGPPQDPNTVETGYCALHTEKRIPLEAISAEQRAEAQAMLQQELAQMGITWDASFSVAWTSQHYGVPDDSPMCKQLLDYCLNAQDFLYCNINGLFTVRPEWSLLSQHGSCPTINTAAFKAYIGRFTYLVIRVTAFNANGEMLDPYLINIRPLERSLNFISADPETYLPKRSTIYIIPGLTSLCSPFSELLHLSTNQAAIRYGDQLAEDLEYLEALEQARLLGETVTEAMSITLAHQFLQENKRSDRLDQLRTLAQHMCDYLPELDAALGYCHNKGVQTCFDTFTHDPAMFHQTLQQYKNS